MKNVSYKLKVCLLGNFLLLMFVLILVVIFRDDKTKYLRWGPQDDLIIISIAINDYTRYFLFLLCIMVINISDVLIQEIAMPILGFNIYNPDKKEITEFSKNELQFYGNAMYLINAIKSILLILVNISQIDIALWGVIVSETASLFTIRMLLNEKTFKKNDDSIELNHNLMENDELDEK